MWGFFVFRIQVIDLLFSLSYPIIKFESDLFIVLRSIAYLHILIALNTIVPYGKSALI